MKESQCNTETVRSLKHLGWGAYKISDVQGKRFTEEKPCDTIACSPKGRHTMIEGKLIKAWCSLNERSLKLRPNQVFALTNNCVKRKGRSFLFIFVKIPPSKSHKGLYKLLVLDWAHHRQAITGDGIPIDLVRSQAIGTWLDPFKRDGKTEWPLERLLSIGK